MSRKDWLGWPWVPRFVSSEESIDLPSGFSWERVEIDRKVSLMRFGHGRVLRHCKERTYPISPETVRYDQEPQGSWDYRMPVLASSVSGLLLDRKALGCV